MAVGFVVALLTQLAVFPLIGLRVALSTNLLIGGVFTAVSIVRTYALRRLFEAIRMRQAERDTAARRGAAVSSGMQRGQSAIR